MTLPCTISNVETRTSIGKHRAQNRLPLPGDVTILHCFALGLTETVTATVLGSSLGTIHARAVQLREYSGTRTRPQLIYWALDREIVPPLPIRGPFGLRSITLDVIDLIVRGWDDRYIGRKLSLAPGTVTNHVWNAMAIVGAWNRTNLVAIAWSEDMIV